MSKAFVASVLRETCNTTTARATAATNELIDAIVKEMKHSGKFTLPGFGTFTIVKTKARKGLNPRTQEAVKIKAGKTVRFKASPTLKDLVAAPIAATRAATRRVAAARKTRRASGRFSASA